MSFQKSGITDLEETVFDVSIWLIIFKCDFKLKEFKFDFSTSRNFSIIMNTPEISPD